MGCDLRNPTTRRKTRFHNVMAGLVPAIDVFA